MTTHSSLTLTLHTKQGIKHRCRKHHNAYVNAKDKARRHSDPAYRAKENARINALKRRQRAERRAKRDQA